MKDFRNTNEKSKVRMASEANRRGSDFTPLIIAHRGASREAPENTLPAFRRAIELGVDGIELDVMLTRDLVPVVTHNDDLSVLTCHKGHVHKEQFQMLRSLDFGSHFGGHFKNTQIPTLSEALSAISTSKILTNIEIKHQPNSTLESLKRIGGIISEFKMTGPVIVSSFNLRIVYQFGRLYPKIQKGLITGPKVFSFFLSTIFDRFSELTAIFPFHQALSKRFVTLAKKKGKMVVPWTVNEVSEIDEICAMGVDGIITNEVQAVLTHFKRR